MIVSRPLPVVMEVEKESATVILSLPAPPSTVTLSKPPATSVVPKPLEMEMVSSPSPPLALAVVRP